MPVIMKISKHWPYSELIFVLVFKHNVEDYCFNFVSINQISDVNNLNWQVSTAFSKKEFRTVVLFCINQWNFISGVNNYPGSNLITGLIVTSVFILLALIMIIICLLLKNFGTKHGILRLREEREDHQMKSM